MGNKLILTISALIFTYLNVSAFDIVLHVSPQGDDSWGNGSVAKPYASLERAVDAIKSISCADDTVTVYFHEGRYCMDRPVEMDSVRNVRLMAYPGDNPLLTASTIIKGWERVRDASVLRTVGPEAAGHLLYVDLAGQGITDFGDPLSPDNRPGLYLDGEAQKLARWPDTGFTYAGRALGKTIIPVAANGNSGAVEGIFEYKDLRIDNWAKEKDPKVGGYWFWDWDDAYYSITSVDTQAGSISVSRDKAFRHGLRFFGLNLLCELDSPGEWYLDRDRGLLYWYPPRDIEAATVTFSLGGFASMLVLQSCSDVTLSNLSFVESRGLALSLQNCTRAAILHCKISNIGSTGIVVNGGNDNVIDGAYITHTGYSAISLTGGDRRNLVYSNFEVSNSILEDFSCFKRTYAVGIKAEGCGIYIHHNELRHSPSSAFRLEGNDIVVEYNLIEDVVRESDDQGGYDLYLNPSMRGINLRYNHWKNITGGTRYGVAGIRLDDVITGVRIYGNVFENCGSIEFGAIQIHGGSENVVEDNVFYRCNYLVSFTTYGEELWKETYDRIHDLMYKEVDINSRAYRMRYPEIREFGRNIDVNIIRNNLSVDMDTLFFNDGGIQIEANNPSVSSEGRPVEYFCTPEYLHPLGIRTVPIAEMGVRYNIWKKNE